MGMLLRAALALCFVMAAVWFGGYLFWLWIVTVGLPSGGPEVALESAVALETARGTIAVYAALALTCAGFLMASGLSWADQRPASAVMLCLGGFAVAGVLAVAATMDPSAQAVGDWDSYGLQEATASTLAVLLSLAALAFTGLAIWSAVRSRFLSDI